MSGLLIKGIIDAIKTKVNELHDVRITSARAAKLDKALQNDVWTSAKAGFLDAAVSSVGGIKSRQTGFVSLSGPTTGSGSIKNGSGEDKHYVDIAIASVNTSKVDVQFEGGVAFAGSENSALTAAVRYGDTARKLVLYRLTSSTNLRLSITVSQDNNAAFVGRWTVIEYN